jgi:hypothetical protein
VTGAVTVLTIASFRHEEGPCYGLARPAGADGGGALASGLIVTCASQPFDPLIPPFSASKGGIMIACSHPAPRLVLVAASEVSDAALARSAIEELGLIPVLVQEAADAIRHLSGDGKRYAAVVVGGRIGQATGFTLCGVARDAGCRLPMLLLTSDACRWTAARAARLQVSVLWQPVPASRLAKTLSVMLPPRPCGGAGVIKLVDPQARFSFASSA